MNTQLQHVLLITEFLYHNIQLQDRCLRKLTEHIHLLTALFTAALYNDIRFEAKRIYTSDPRIQSWHLKSSKNKR